ncbi:MAG TPA: hypothetical protein VGF44_03175 [Terriglobales bacterium]|jgi:hypothetical protein
MCELLPIRDYLDNVMVRTDGSFVAGYELRGLNTYFASDEGRDRGKTMLEALLRSVPEQSMRLQIRYEVAEDTGDLLERYVASQRSDTRSVVDLDAVRVERWRQKEKAGAFTRPLVSAYFIWDAACDGQ